VIDLAYGCWVLLLLLELATEPDASLQPDAPPPAEPDAPGAPRPLDGSDPIARSPDHPFT
jgi:hypothetical protein